MKSCRSCGKAKAFITAGIGVALRFDAIQLIVGGGDNNPQKKGVVLEMALWPSAVVCSGDVDESLS